MAFLYIRSGQSAAKTPEPPTSPAYRNTDSGGRQAVREHGNHLAAATTGDNGTPNDGPAGAREQEELRTTVAGEKALDGDHRPSADDDLRATRRSLNTAAVGIRTLDDNRPAIGSITMFRSRMQPPPFGVQENNNYVKENRHSNHKNGNNAVVDGDNTIVSDLDTDNGMRQNVNR